MHRFPTDSFCQQLIKAVKMPVIIDDISNEIRSKFKPLLLTCFLTVMAIHSLTQIIDIYPGHVPYCVQLGIAAAIKGAMQEGQGFIELQE